MGSFKSLILCEGETDQALIGSYLEATSDWCYSKGIKNMPFPNERIWNYQRSNGDALGIWQIGGNDFCQAIKTIMQGEKQERIVESIIIVTDHDDADAEVNRLQSILDTISSELCIDKLKQEDYQNIWSSIAFDYAFGSTSIRFCYLLIPLDHVGALETFMMDSLSEQSPEKDNVISQSKEFIANFTSQTYLKERREKVKAELGVSLSVFSPDRIFKTMKELIDSVQWEEFATANAQFERLEEL